MILYLTSNQNIGLLDFIANEHGLPMKRLAGTFMLNRFVTRDMRSFDHITRLVIDLTAMQDTEEALVQAVSAFQTMYDARIIILADDRVPGDSLLSALYDAGIRNYVCSPAIPDMQQEILQCLSVDGMSAEAALRFKIQPVDLAEPLPEASSGYRFNCNGLKIMIAGCGERAGVTTTALNLTHFLASIGAKTAYLEAGPKKDIRTLPVIHKGVLEASGGSYVHQSASCYPERQKYRFEDYHFNVIDLGPITPANMPLLAQAEVCIICGLARPYAIVDLLDTLKLLHSIDVHVLLMACPTSCQEMYSQAIGSNSRQIHFAEYSSSLFDSRANAALWGKLLGDHILRHEKPERSKLLTWVKVG